MHHSKILRRITCPICAVLIASVLSVSSATASEPVHASQLRNQADYELRKIDAEEITDSMIQSDMYNTLYSAINMRMSLNNGIAEKKTTMMSYDRAYTRITSAKSMYITNDIESYISRVETIESRGPKLDYDLLNENKDTRLTPHAGVYHGPSGKETYYNLPMGGVVYLMRSLGYSEDEYPFWIRDDGVKMFGDYVMVAANLKIRPKGTIVESSMGTAMVCDTGDLELTQLDIAVSWE